MTPMTHLIKLQNTTKDSKIKTKNAEENWQKIRSPNTRDACLNVAG